MYVQISFSPFLPFSPLAPSLALVPGLEHTMKSWLVSNSWSRSLRVPGAGITDEHTLKALTVR